ncbi:MAG: restriction endonuclease subunit S [Candidatus Gastranaerophilaceae bacterium]|nr:restriction endonuclease subunit S [Candidatus Gastranaerophilaceae bacterium]
MKAETLKKAILQYAMQGKLVEQDPNDEPASILLERIKAEKEQLIKDGKIKIEKPLPPISEDEIPCELPKGWEWVRLSQITSIIGDGIHGTPEYTLNTEYYFINGNNLNNGIIEIKDNTKTVSENEYLKYKKDLSERTVLVSINGTLGNVAFYNNEKVMLGKSACYFNLLSDINKLYLKLILNSDYFLKYADNKATGTTIKNVSLKAMQDLLIPLPPLAEQQRIVEKLEQILPLVEEYGKNEEKLSKLNSTLPDKIKQSILQHAVQGKLVPQNPSDEPASVLLNRIKAEKEQLIKDGKIKKEKPLPPITEDEIPFELPNGWQCVRLGSIIEIARGGSPRPIQDYLTNSPDGLNWIKIGDSDKGGKYINSTKEKITKEGLNKTRFVRKGDFLLSNSMSFGRPYILNIDGCIHDGWLVLSNIEKCFNKDFLYYLLSSYYIYQQFCGSVSGAVVKNLNTDKVSNAVVCIPPLAEQQRIVTKVEELLSIVESLKR